MNILVVNYEYPPIGGGGGFVTRDLAEQWAEKGHRVTVITSRYSGLQKYELVNGVEVRRVPVLLRNKAQVASHASMLSYVPSAILEAILTARSRPYDIINTHFAVPSGPAGLAISRLLKIPNILSIHGGDIFDPSKSLSPHKTPILSSVVKSMLNSADRVVAQSSDTRGNAIKYYGVIRSVDIIPLGIREPKFELSSREHFGLPKDAFVMATIGRLVKRKNLEDAIKILSTLKKSGPFRLIIIGDGPEMDNLRNLVKQLNAEENVNFFGNVDDETKFQLLDISDLYVSTASHEGFGLVFLEAMACGLPVLCYNRGGQNDFLQNAKSGYLVELNDNAEFIKRIMELFEERKKLEEMGRFCKSLVENYYIEKCADHYIRLFQGAQREKGHSVMHIEGMS